MCWSDDRLDELQHEAIKQGAEQQKVCFSQSRSSLYTYKEKVCMQIVELSMYNVLHPVACVCDALLVLRLDLLFSQARLAAMFPDVSEPIADGM
jgi:hypothetical protein